MRHLETPSDLTAAWKTISSRIPADLVAMRGLQIDPIGTVRDLGYELGPEAAEALLSALP